MKFRNIHREFTAAKCRFTYAFPEDMYLHRWQTERKVDKWYVIYRILYATLFATLIYWHLRTNAKHRVFKELIYLTYISSVMYFLHSFVAMLAVCAAYLKQDKDEVVDVPILFHLYMGLTLIATDAAVFVTFSFWTYLRYLDQGPLGIWSQNFHTWNAILLLMDFTLSSVPWRLAHFYVSLSYGFLYFLFTIVYYWSGGTNMFGRHYIYSNMDWERPGIASGTFIALMVLFFLIHFFVFFLHRCKYEMFIRSIWRTRFVGRKMAYNMRTIEPDFEQL